MEIEENQEAAIRINVRNVIKDTYNCSTSEVENLIVEIIKNVRLSSNKDIVIEKALKRLKDHL